MNIKRYNEILVSVVLTSIGILVIWGVGSYFVSEISDYTRNRKKNLHKYVNSIKVEEESPIDNSEQQNITETKEIEKKYFKIGNPSIIDSLKQIYLIPIGRKDYKPQQLSSIRTEGYRRTYPGAGIASEGIVRSGAFSYYNDNGTFNNFVIYSDLNKKRKKIFDFKAIIKRWSCYSEINDNIILFEVIDKDDNFDGFLNSDDLSKLYVYNLQKNKLSKLSFSNSDLISYKTLHDSKKLLINFGLDVNNDNKYDKEEEPNAYYLLNLDNLNLEKLITNDLVDEIKSLLND